MVRVLEKKIPVRVELNIETTFYPEAPGAPNGINTIAEIPGTDLADEVVIMGAHFDTTAGATGATDNATGSAAMMEAVRIIKTLGLRPRRTIRVALWGGEEQGLLGSRAYVAEHYGTDASRKPAHAKVAAYYNLDNGTGKIRGIWGQGNLGAMALFQGVDRVGRRSRASRLSARARWAPRTTPRSIPQAFRDSSSCRSASSTTRERITRTWISSIAFSATIWCSRRQSPPFLPGTPRIGRTSCRGRPLRRPGRRSTRSPRSHRHQGRSPVF